VERERNVIGSGEEREWNGRVTIEEREEKENGRVNGK
jgi:hypothetical protein